MLEVFAPFLSAGFHSVDIGLLFARVLTGVFFAISGFHKLFNAERHATLHETMVRDVGPRFADQLCYFVPGVEFLGGCALIVGFLTVPAALGLLAILLVACKAEAADRVKAYRPINRADAIDDFLYLPEVVYMIPLALILCNGAGVFSIDSLAF